MNAKKLVVLCALALAFAAEIKIHTVANEETLATKAACTTRRCQRRNNMQKQRQQDDDKNQPKHVHVHAKRAVDANNQIITDVILVMENGTWVEYVRSMRTTRPTRKVLTAEEKIQAELSELESF
jgi:hypothetical protein